MAGFAAAGGAADGGGALWVSAAGDLADGEGAGACANVAGGGASGVGAVSAMAGSPCTDAWGTPRGACATLPDFGAAAAVVSTDATFRGVAAPNQRACTML